MEKKKIGLLGALLMGIGCIVGSGIFGTLPTVANEYGAGGQSGGAGGGKPRVRADNGAGDSLPHHPGGCRGHGAGLHPHRPAGLCPVGRLYRQGERHPGHALDVLTGRSAV